MTGRCGGGRVVCVGGGGGCNGKRKRVLTRPAHQSADSVKCGQDQ